MRERESGQIGDEGKTAPRAIWLVRMSVFFAVCLEVVPMEMELMNGVSWPGSLALVLLVKAGCLTLIFLPLLIFVFLNGVRALEQVRGRVIVVVVIVAVKLAIDLLLTVSRDSGRPTRQVRIAIESDKGDRRKR